MILISEYFFLFLLWLLADNKEKYARLLYVLGCLSLTFLTVFRRADIGPDTQVYCDGFHDISSLPWNQLCNWRWEKGYTFLNKIIGLFFQTDRSFIMVMGVLILSLIFWGIWTYSELPNLSLIIFYSMGLWSSSNFIYRQWYAIAILVFSIKYIKEKNLKKFLAVVFIACLFHKTAIVFFLVYIVYNYVDRNRIIFYSGVVTVLLAVFADYIMTILNHFARIEQVEKHNGGWNFLLLLWGIVIFFNFVKMKEENIVNDVYIYFVPILIGATLQPISLFYSNWARIIMYFSFYIIVFIPNILAEILVALKFNKKEEVWFQKYINPIKYVFGVILFLGFLKMGMTEYAFMWN